MTKPKRKPSAKKKTAMLKPDCTCMVEIKIDGRLLFGFPVKIWPNETMAQLAMDVGGMICERMIKVIPIKVYGCQKFDTELRGIPF